MVTAVTLTYVWALIIIFRFYVSNYRFLEGDDQLFIKNCKLDLKMLFTKVLKTNNGSNKEQELFAVVNALGINTICIYIHDNVSYFELSAVLFQAFLQKEAFK